MNEYTLTVCTRYLDGSVGHDRHRVTATSEDDARTKIAIASNSEILFVQQATFN